MRNFFKQFQRPDDRASNAQDKAEHDQEAKPETQAPQSNTEPGKPAGRAKDPTGMMLNSRAGIPSGSSIRQSEFHGRSAKQAEELNEQLGTHSRISSIGNVHEFMDKQADELCIALHAHATSYGERLKESIPGLEFSLTEVQRVAEPNNWMPRQQKSALPKTGIYTRWRLDSTNYTLSVRAARGLIEFFIVPEKDAPHISMSEYGSRFRGAFNLVQDGDDAVWKKDAERLSAESAMRFLEILLDEVAVSRGQLKGKSFQTAQPTFVQTTEMKLEQEKNNLLFKLLNQREELKNQLARDLHDSVIADLMMLKRYLSGDKKLSTEETIEIVDEIVKQLRDIVNEYSPRQLQEWGLKVGIEDMLDRIEKRTGLNIDFQFEGELPNYPDLVGLHIFRVIQESMNNIEKHASATAVVVKIKANPKGKCVFSVNDNGTGFEPAKVRLEADGSHSMGLEGMRERVELIRCFYSCEIQIESQPSRGTTVTLTVAQP